MDDCLLFTPGDVELVMAAASCCQQDDYYIAQALGLEAGAGTEAMLVPRFENLADRLRQYLDQHQDAPRQAFIMDAIQKAGIEAAQAWEAQSVARKVPQLSSPLPGHGL